MSATGPMQAGWSASSRLKAGRWRSRGETGTGIAVLGRTGRGCERETMSQHVIMAEGRRGLRCSRRAERRRAAPSQGPALLVLSRVREAHMAAARSEGQGGGGRLRRKDRLSVARSAPARQAVAAKGNGEGRDRGTDGRGSGRSPGRPSRWRSSISGRAHGGDCGGQAAAGRASADGAQHRGREAEAAAGAGARWLLRARAAQARMRQAAMRGGGTAKRGEPIAAEAATGS